MAVLRGIIERFRTRREEPILPPSAALIAVQHPSAALPERSYDLVLLGVVLALLGIGTIEIYSATAGESLTQYNDSSHYLQRQILYAAAGGLAMWLGARLDYRR